jgi:hypothetical protein
MIPATHASNNNAADLHAKRLVALYQLQKLYLEFKAQFALTDRLDRAVDQAFGVCVCLVGIVLATFTAWYFITEAFDEGMSVAATVRFVSWAMSFTALSVVAAAIGIWLSRMRFSTHRNVGRAIIYGLAVAFAMAVFGLIGVIPVAMLLR